MSLGKYIFIIVLSCCLFGGCSLLCIITDTPGYYSGYDKLDNKDKEIVTFVGEADSVDSLNDKSKIYAVSGHKMRELLSTLDTTLVYYCSAHCSSENCFITSAIVDFARSNNYEIILVLDYYYDFERFMDDIDLLNYPLFIANEKYYGTKKCEKYEYLFTSDLLLDNAFRKKKENWGKRYFLFNKGVLINSVNNPYKLR